MGGCKDDPLFCYGSSLFTLRASLHSASRALALVVEKTHHHNEDDDLTLRGALVIGNGSGACNACL